MKGRISSSLCSVSPKLASIIQAPATEATEATEALLSGSILYVNNINLWYYKQRWKYDSEMVRLRDEMVEVGRKSTSEAATHYLYRP